MSKQIIVSILILCFGCTVIRPKTPDLPSQTVQPQITPSSINIPVTVNLSNAEKLINKRLPTIMLHQKGIDIGNNMTLEVNAKRHKPIKLHTQGGAIIAEIPIYIYGRVDWFQRVKTRIGPFSFSWKAIKHHKDYNAVVVVRTRTDLSVNKHWKVKSSTSSKFDLVEAPSFNVLGFKINISSKTRKEIAKQLPHLNKLIDQGIGEAVDLRASVEQGWKSLEAPIEINTPPVSTWIVFRPEYFNLAPPISLSKNQIQFNFGLRTSIAATTRVKPATYPLGTLPPLRDKAISSNEFQIQIPTKIDYVSLNAHFRTHFKGATDTIPKGKISQFKITDTGKALLSIPHEDRIVTYTDISVKGLGKEVLVTVGIKSKGLTGVLYLKGVPSFNPQNNQVRLKNLHFTSETNKILLDKAVWLADKFFIEKIESKLHYDLSKLTTEMSIKLASRLQEIHIGKHVQLNANLKQLALSDIYFEEDCLQLILTAKGQARAVVFNPKK